jgi:hypothetical protein
MYANSLGFERGKGLIPEAKRSYGRLQGKTLETK